MNQLGVADTLLWATKVNVAGRGGTAANPAAARAQTEKSFAILKRPTIDLIQVHDMGDLATQLPIVHEFKKAGRVRYVGITTTFPNQYAQLIDVMRNEPLDFFGVDYAADNRDVENVILPLAIDEKIALLAYPPLGRTSLFRRAVGNELPAFAKEFDATTWAQFFLTLTHPAITAVTPATSQARIGNSIEVGGVQALVPCLERTGERASARPPPRRCASRAVRPAVRMGDPGPAGRRGRTQVRGGASADGCGARDAPRFVGAASMRGSAARRAPHGRRGRRRPSGGGSALRAHRIEAPAAEARR